jgi:phosphatidylserine decarboxylase
MVKEGYYFGVPLLVAGGVAYWLHWYVAAAVLVFLALFVFSFFRDPERVIPTESGAVVSPGDGRVVVVTEEENAGRPGKRVSIFLALWNVHVNRSPAAGTIATLEYRPENSWQRCGNGLPWKTNKTCSRCRRMRERSCSSRLRG